MLMGNIQWNNLYYQNYLNKNDLTKRDIIWIFVILPMVLMYVFSLANSSLLYVRIFLLGQIFFSHG